jgi:phycocyanobilin:ferredoxin oxidoreductase
MDTPLINQMRDLAFHIKSEFGIYLNQYDNEKHIHEFEGWSDWFWSSDKIRKAHLKIIEPTEKNKKLWLMHLNVFPESNMDIPIFGLDIVATPNKISGCFCDYSPTNESASQEEYLTLFKDITSNLEWKRERELPPWATEIFSKDMIAAGSIREGEEADQLCIAVKTLVEFYMKSLVYKEPTENLDLTSFQNKYCINQKMNKMLHSSITAMGISEKDKNQYIENVLFEEIN